MTEPHSEPEDAAPSAIGVADGVQRALDPRYVPFRKVVGLLSSAGRSLLWGAVTIGAISATATGAARANALIAFWAGTTVAFFVRAWLWPPVEYRYASYRVDRSGMEIRRGVLWRSVTTVPRSRVQHTDVSQGPFERRFGLGTLLIHTAGSFNSVVTVPGLAHDQALAIREHLLPRHETDVV